MSTTSSIGGRYNRACGHIMHLRRHIAIYGFGESGHEYRACYLQRQSINRSRRGMYIYILLYNSQI